jgi:alkaline phosphatase D
MSRFTTLAFGSCHKRKAVSPKDGIIWDAIRAEHPQAFLWTGDAIYPPSRGVASLSQLQGEYQQMLTNDTIGYSKLRPPLGIYGTWDDHDYGANDAGNELPSREQRRQLFQQFLNYSQDLQTKISSRNGLYHSIDFLSTGIHTNNTNTNNQSPQRVKTHRPRYSLES